MTRDGRAVALRGAKQRALLAALALHAGEPVSAERLAIALWGEEAPASAVKTVQVHVSRLRQALGDPPELTTTPAGYRLDLPPERLDAARFEALLAQGRPADALELWRGPALAELAYAPFAQDEIARLEERRLEAQDELADARLAAGHHHELVGELQRRAAEQPLRERTHAQLMLALYRCGRQAEALDAFRELRGRLVNELGLEPGRELRELEAAILRQDAGLEAPGRATLRVPPAPTPTVGRAADLARLREALGASRLVTVLGPGGVGKTRLAQEVARELAGRYADGADFVSLAAVRAADHVASAIARRLDTTVLASESVEAALARELGRRELLLVLDNFEHVLEAAGLVADLLAAAPRLTLLVTSRAPLELRAERRLRLEPLAPEPAAELFAAAAQAHDFPLAAADTAAVREICRRLDGLPLALELAAGRLGLLSAPDLLGHLDLGALHTTSRDVPERQRTLAATLEWSHSLLDAPEQAALTALAVFTGGCTLAAAQAVTGARLAVLEALVAKNLVLARPRLGLLETVRAFALERLAERPEAEAVRERHARHYLELAEGAVPELRRTASAALLAELDLEIDNLRAALGWFTVHGHATEAVRLATAFVIYAKYWGLYDEARQVIDTALALEPVPARVRAAALDEQAYLLARPPTNERAEAAARESVALRRAEGDRFGLASSLCALATAALHRHAVAETYRRAGEAAELARETGNEHAGLNALATRAVVAPTLTEARSLGAAAAARYRAAGNVRRLAQLQSDLAYTALYLGDAAVARELAGESLALAETLGEAPLIAAAEGNLGLAALLHADADAAVAAFARELEIGREPAFGMLYEAVHGLGTAAALRGRDELAATLLGAAGATTAERHDPVIARRFEEAILGPACERLGAERWRAAYAAGAALEREEAIDAARRSAGR